MQKGKARNIPANGNIVRRFHLPGSLRLCDFFPRGGRCFIVGCAPWPDSAAACVSAACEITAGCAAFAALGGKAALYGICLAMSLLGFSVWGQLRLLLQGRVPMRMLAISRLLHAVLFPLLVRLLLWALPQEQTVFSTLAPRVVPMCRLPPGCRCGGGGVSLHTALQRLQKHL